MEILKHGKASGINGIIGGMLKYGEVVIDWMHTICNLAWIVGKMPGDWTKAAIVPLLSHFQSGKGKGDEND